MTRNSAFHFVAHSLRFAFALALLSPLPQAFAQTRTVGVKVPFAFQNGSERLPAGTYYIAVQSDRTLLLRDASGRTHGLTMTMADQKLTAPTRSTVVFHREDGQYKLQSIWTAGNATGIRCLPIRSEKKRHVEVGAVPADNNTEVALNTLSY